MDHSIESLEHPQPAWFKPFARLGYGSRGLVYLVIAFFTLLTSFSAGENQSTHGAIQFLTRNRFGTILTVLLIVGLAAYSLWRFIQAVFDTDNHGAKPTGLGVRAGLLASCGTYAVLCAYTFSLWWGTGPFGGSGGKGKIAHFVAGTVSLRYAALVLATIFIVVACAHFWKAVKRKFEKYIEAPETIMWIIDPLAMAGLIARGTIFLLIAFLLYLHGFSSQDSGGKSPGLKDALDYILHLPAGHWWLALTGIGLLAFAAYSFSEAVWRRINVEAV